jgi:hypothetical protein
VSRSHSDGCSPYYGRLGTCHLVSQDRIRLLAFFGAAAGLNSDGIECQLGIGIPVSSGLGYLTQRLPAWPKKSRAADGQKSGILTVDGCRQGATLLYRSSEVKTFNLGRSTAEGVRRAGCHPSASNDVTAGVPIVVECRMIPWSSPFR